MLGAADMKTYLTVFLCILPGCTSYEIFVCPSLSNWKFRAKWFCNNTLPARYTCLYYEIQQKFIESCSYAPDSLDPGEQYIISHHPHGVKCLDENKYQPYRMRINAGARCVFRRSVCGEEGQVVFHNGTSKDDRSCRCDFEKDFAFNIKPTKACECIPSEEDCSCFKKRCPVGYILTPDYECVHMNNRTYVSVCPDMGPDRLKKGGGHQIRHIKHTRNEDHMNTSKVPALIISAISVCIVCLGFLYVCDSLPSCFYYKTSPPKNFTVTKEPDSLKFTWLKPDNGQLIIKEYRIYFTTEDNDNWFHADFWTVEPDKLYFFWACNCMLPSTTYRFRISTCFIDFEESQKSEQADIFERGDPPSNFIVSEVTKCLKFTWSKPSLGSDCIDKYNIYFTTDTLSSSDWENAEFITIENDRLYLFWTHADISPATTYRFRISTCFNNSVESRKGVEITFEVGEPVPPKKFDAYGEDGKILLNWTHATANLFKTEKYKMQVSIDKWKTIKHEEYISCEQSEYEITEVQLRKYYCFRLYTCSKGVSSSPIETSYYSGTAYRASFYLHNEKTEHNIENSEKQLIQNEVSATANGFFKDLPGNQNIQEIFISFGSVFVVIIFTSEDFNDEHALREKIEKNLHSGVFGKYKASAEGFEFMTLNRPMPPQFVKADLKGNNIKVTWSAPPATFFATAKFIVQYTTDEWKCVKETSVPSEFHECQIPVEIPFKLYKFRICTCIEDSVRSQPSTIACFKTTGLSVEHPKATFDKFKTTSITDEKYDTVCETQQNYTAEHAYEELSETKHLSLKESVKKHTYVCHCCETMSFLGSFCMDCVQVYCAECTRYHRKLKTTRTHSLLDVTHCDTDFGNSKVLASCSSGCREQIESLCLDCLELFCDKCTRQHPTTDEKHCMITAKLLEADSSMYIQASEPSTNNKNTAAQVPVAKGVTGMECNGCKSYGELISFCVFCEQVLCNKCTQCHTRFHTLLDTYHRDVDLSDTAIPVDWNCGNSCGHFSISLCLDCKQLLCKICTKRHSMLKATKHHWTIAATPLTSRIFNMELETEKSPQRGILVHEFKIYISSDKNKPGIRGIQILSDGRFVVADYRNRVLKLFNKKYKCVTAKSTKEDPRGIVVTSNDMIAVTIAEKKEIRLYTIDMNRICLAKTFSVKEKPFSIAYNDDHFAVETGEGIDGAIRIYDTTGIEKHVITGQFSFGRYTGNTMRVALNFSKQCVYVADIANEKIHSVSFKNEYNGWLKLRSPRGIISHKEALIVASSGDNMLYHVNTRDGRIYKLLDKEVIHPRYVAYQANTKMLAVEAEGYKIKLYQTENQS